MVTVDGKIAYEVTVNTQYRLNCSLPALSRKHKLTVYTEMKEGCSCSRAGIVQPGKDFILGGEYEVESQRYVLHTNKRGSGGCIISECNKKRDYNELMKKFKVPKCPS